MLRCLDILIVDDQPDDLECFTRLLRNIPGYDYRCTFSHDGQQALTLLAKTDFDCVVLDYSLPGMDGLALLNAIRINLHDIAIVMLTGQAREDIAAAALKAGANNYIDKSSISIDNLHETIIAAITQCDLAKQAAADGSLRFLLIDDSADDRENYMRLLKSAQYHSAQFVEAASGQSGLKSFFEGRFDAVLLDYSMPGMDGLEVLRQVRADNPFIPVIFMTGQGNVATAVAALRSGASDYLVKSLLDAVQLCRTVSASVVKAAIAAKDAEILATTEALRASEERYRLQAASLQEANERVTLATDSGGIGLWEWNVKHDRMIWDAWMYRLLGMQPQEKAPTYEDWRQRLHPDDQVATVQALRDAIQKGKPYKSEFRVVWDDGSVHHIRCAGDVMSDADGNVIRITGANWDVTDQRNEVEQRAIIIEAAPNGMMIVNEQGLITLANSEVGRIFDYPSSALVGQSVEILVPEALGAMQGTLRAGLASGRGGVGKAPQRQFTGRKRDGSTLTVEIMLSPIKTQGGQIVVASVLDVTDRVLEAAERKRVETRERLAAAEANSRLDRLSRHLASARDRADEANNAKSRFLAGMTHELRTPLHGILGYAELLSLEGGLNALQSERLEVMMAAGQHLLGMINAVLDMSQIEADQLELSLAEVDLAELSRVCLAVVRPAAEAKGLTLAPAPAVGPSAYADPLRLRQVLINLLGNAVKFTPAGGVEVRLQPAQDGARVRLEVVDTGPGIWARHRDKLFQTFERLNAEVVSGIEGAGLGLAIAARLVQLMDGRIGYDDNPSGGSVFWLELPACSPAVVTPIEPAPTAPLTDTPRLSVLVVDDEAMNRSIASGFLSSAGHQVVCVDNGAAAVAAAAASDFDVILMDVRMPGMNGMDATRRIRALPGRRGKVRVVALTAQAFAQQITICLEAGMDSHVSKPFKQNVLLAALQDVGTSTNAAAAAVTPPVIDAVRAEPDSPLFDRSMFEDIQETLPAAEMQTHLQTLITRFDSLLRGLRSPGMPAGAISLVEDAHRLAGGAGTFGFLRVAAAARRFEVAAQADAAETAALTDQRPATIELAAAIEASTTLVRQLLAETVTVAT